MSEGDARSLLVLGVLILIGGTIALPLARGPAGIIAWLSLIFGLTLIGVGSWTIWKRVPPGSDVRR